MKQFDLNCDMGEGIGNDELIMPYITSANIACGFHAGDEKTMEETIVLAKEYKVNIGAHPSFWDKENFGRTEMKASPEKVYQLVTKQINILQRIAADNNASLHHVKPHGALYNMAAKDKKLAAAIARAVKDADGNLILFGLSNSFLIVEGKAAGLKTANEVFADRTYQDDGSLTPRTHANALIETVHEVIHHVSMMLQGKVRTLSGKEIPVIADTLCIHGDGKYAVEFAQAISATFTKMI